MDELKNWGLEEMNPTDENGVNGGVLYPWDESSLIVCCYNIPPIEILY